MKNFILKFLDHEAPKMDQEERFSSFMKNHYTKISWFLQQQVYSYSNMTLCDFFGKNLLLGFLDKKGTQNEFFKFWNKLMHWIFIIFYMKLQQIMLLQFHVKNYKNSMHQFIPKLKKLKAHKAFYIS